MEEAELEKTHTHTMHARTLFVRVELNSGTEDSEVLCQRESRARPF